MTFIDLFCGIGGFRIGLERLKFKCVFSSEIERDARFIYELNFGETPSGDITKIDAKDIPDHDILCAGFPCQPYSLLGKKKGFDDDRGNLFLEIIRILREKKPSYFILENVSGLKFLEDGSYLREILKQLNLSGYQTHTLTLNSADFGVPQYRKRIYFVGFRDAKEFFYFDRPEEEKRVNLKDILEPTEDELYYIPKKRLDTFKPIYNRKSKYLKQVGYFDEPFEARRRVHSAEGCATTLLSSSDDNTKILLKDGRIRWLTEKELLQCQGFPKDFKLGGLSYRNFNKLIGNSVTTNVISAIGLGMTRSKMADNLTDNLEASIDVKRLRYI